MGEKPLKDTKFTMAMRSEMERLVRTCAFSDRKRFVVPAGKARNGRSYYKDLGDALNGIPWWFIACIHGMECGWNFSRHLHNGDPLKRRTVNEPVGRPAAGSPPFDFRFSAIDALTMEGKQFHLETDWSMAHALWLLECYNGLGYRLYRQINTPYLWAGTNHYKCGKYVADKVWSAHAVSKQAGCAGLLLELGVLR